MIEKLVKLKKGGRGLPLDETKLAHLGVDAMDLSDVTFCGRKVDQGIIVSAIPKGDPVPEGSFKIKLGVAKS